MSTKHTSKLVQNLRGLLQRILLNPYSTVILAVISSVSLVALGVLMQLFGYRVEAGITATISVFILLVALFGTFTIWLLGKLSLG